jgi:hypothetical protein
MFFCQVFLAVYEEAQIISQITEQNIQIVRFANSMMADNLMTDQEAKTIILICH